MTNRPAFLTQTFENGAAAIEAFLQLNSREALEVEDFLVVNAVLSPTWIERCLLDWIDENVA